MNFKHALLFLSLTVYKGAFGIGKKTIDSKVALTWAKASTEFIKHQPGSSPTYIARALGYLGLTMYESVVNGSKVYQSIAPYLNGLGTLPKPSSKIDWETSLNEGQYYMILKLYQHSDIRYVKILDSLHTRILADRSKKVKNTVIENSQRYGTQIAEKIHQWALTDGGDMGYFKNFDAGYIFPVGLQYWVAPINGQSPSIYPLHPYWGKNRVFVKPNAFISIPIFSAYSTDPNSVYYKDFEEIYRIQKTLTQEQKQIAVWWADDPNHSSGPPGHSYNIARIIGESRVNNLFEMSSIFAKTGLAVADAFIVCWKVKYHYHSERPANYIRRNIDSTFIQFWPEPPFPSYISGHATQVGAASVVLQSSYGDSVAFVDDTHVEMLSDPKTKTPYLSRKFNTITQMTEECGMSRLYGGIHIRSDNTDGLEVGYQVGKNVDILPWRRE
ncbi:MAG: vanadium-dependent haloperoxidase [Leadbetterella sp.]